MATEPLLGDELCVHELLQMEGEGGISHFRRAEKFLRSRSRSSCCDEMTKKSKTSGLRKSGEGSSGVVDIHISSVFEMLLKLRDQSAR